jgi:hypothetical protein
MITDSRRTGISCIRGKPRLISDLNACEVRAGEGEERRSERDSIGSARHEARLPSGPRAGIERHSQYFINEVYLSAWYLPSVGVWSDRQLWWCGEGPAQARAASDENDSRGDPGRAAERNE